MIYTNLCVMLLMRAASITSASGRGFGPGNIPLVFVMEAARIKRIMHGAV